MKAPDDEHKFVEITILGSMQRSLQVEILDIAGRRMRIAADEKIPIDAAVQVEYEGSFLLGEVLFCESEGPRHVIGVNLQHALSTR